MTEQVPGTVLRARTSDEKAAAVSAFEKDILPDISSGKIVPNIDRVYPVHNVADAHRYLESNESFGKVVLAFG